MSHTLTLLFRQELNSDGTICGYHATHEGQHIMALFPDRATFLSVKEKIDALWNARQEEAWASNCEEDEDLVVPSPGPDEEALAIQVAGAWGEETSPFLPRRHFKVEAVLS